MVSRGACKRSRAMCLGSHARHRNRLIADGELAAHSSRSSPGRRTRTGWQGWTRGYIRLHACESTCCADVHYSSSNTRTVSGAHAQVPAELNAWSDLCVCRTHSVQSLGLQRTHHGSVTLTLTLTLTLGLQGRTTAQFRAWVYKDAPRLSSSAAARASSRRPATPPLFQITSSE